MESTRPTEYTPELANEICNRLIQGETLLQIGHSSKLMPYKSTVRKWRAQHPDFDVTLRAIFRLRRG